MKSEIQHSRTNSFEEQHASNAKHITLLRTPIVCAINTYSAPATAPLALAYLSASLIKAGFRCTPIDTIGEAIDTVNNYHDLNCQVRGLTIEEIVEYIPKDTDILGVSCMFSQEWIYIKKILRAIKIKYPSMPIVAGGEHASALAKNILESCHDIEVCALGEGEETIVDIARYYPQDPDKIPGIIYRKTNGSLIITEKRTRIRNVEEIPRPAWNLLPLEAYLKRGLGQGVNAGRSIPILGTRGCPFECTFCSNKQMYTQRYYTRSPKDVVAEIEEYIEKYLIDSVEFFDLTAIIKKNWILEFCNLIKKHNINITWSLPSGTRSEALDSEVTKLMSETGCQCLVYAAESGSPRTLKQIKKKIDLPKMIKSMKAAKKNGLELRCNLIVGFPQETRWDIYKTFWLSIKCAWIGVDDCPFFIFSPYPGTSLFNYLRETGVIPKLDDEYFQSLLCMRDMTKTSRYCENISPIELSFYSVFGMLTFYALSYLFFPLRLIRSYKNVIKREGKTSTVFEQRIVEIMDTKRNLRLSQKIGDYRIIEKKVG